MPLIQILSDKQRMAYQRPSRLSATQRKSFFRLPAALQIKTSSFDSISNKIGFRLMFGYFLIDKRFYPTSHYTSKDIKYLCNLYGMLSIAFDHEDYNYSTYRRHRLIILDHFLFESYVASGHDLLISNAIKDQIYSWEEYGHILGFIKEWLEWRHVEAPSYYRLQYIITKSVRKRDTLVKSGFRKLLSPDQRTALQQLEQKGEGENGEYKLTTIHQLNPSHAPKHIRSNIEKLHFIQAIYLDISPLLNHLNLNSKAIRHIGQTVSQDDSYNILRRENTDKYFHLAVFIAYQLSVFEDWMARTFIVVCQLALNQVNRNEKDKLYEQKTQRAKLMKTLFEISQNKIELIQTIKAIIWKGIPAIQKEKELQALLPYDQESDINEQEEISQDIGDDTSYHDALTSQSIALQHRATPIINHLTFQIEETASPLGRATSYFKETQGNISTTAPKDFLPLNDQEALTDKRGKFKPTLYKILLFQAVSKALKNGTINLEHSYKYKAMDDYLISKDIWNSQSDELLDKANLSHLKNLSGRIHTYKKILHHHFEKTNTAILTGDNKHFRKGKTTPYYITTPKIEKEEIDSSLFPKENLISLSQVLSTIDQACFYTDALRHFKVSRRKSAPHRSAFLAVITAFGCNLGINTMAKAATHLHGQQLENIAKWYFEVDNINRANDIISNFILQFPLANKQKLHEEKLSTSSDGQKIKVVSEHTIFANYSAKYFNKGKGVSAYSFVDERSIPFYSTIIDSSIREASYVLDGLLHNDAIQSTMHTTDTHGYTEALFGLMNLLGFGFSPNIAKLHKQTLYAFKEHKIASYVAKGYAVLPIKHINESIITKSIKPLLRLVTSLKLKHCKASDIFLRFNSYSRQHPLYVAIKEYGRIHKTIQILRNIDDLDFREESRKNANRIELSNRFSSAIYFANGGEMVFLTRQQQLKAEACKRLIKNAIVCWNYLYLTRKIQQSAQPEVLLSIIKKKTANAWGHIYFNGTYDFSDDSLMDQYDLLRSQNYSLNST